MTTGPMKLEWKRSSGKEDIFGIYIDRGGVKYPIAIIEFPPALGRDDLERLFRGAPELLQRLKETRDAIASLPNDALGTAWPDDSPPLFIKDELLGNIAAAIAKVEAS